MDKSSIKNALSALDKHSALELRPGSLYLILAPRRLGRLLMNSFAARLALVGGVRILDSGNWFDALAVARQVRRQTAQLDQVLGRVQVQRAFTCYQAAVLLNQQPSGREPVLVLDLLSTFADESVPLNERARLLDQAVADLRRLSSLAPTAVSAAPTPSGADGVGLPAGHPARFTAPLPAMLAQLEDAADQVVHLMLPEGAVQPALW